LKGNSRPSSGYCDVVFLASSGRVQVIAGDIDGAVRAWDVRFPQKPLWIVSSGNQPINSLALTHDQRYLLIGTEAGLLMV
jgi:WD40 repeat protein